MTSHRTQRTDPDLVRSETETIQRKDRKTRLRGFGLVRIDRLD